MHCVILPKKVQYYVHRREMVRKHTHDILQCFILVMQSNPVCHLLCTYVLKLLLYDHLNCGSTFVPRYVVVLAVNYVPIFACKLCGHIDVNGELFAHKNIGGFNI